MNLQLLFHMIITNNNKKDYRATRYFYIDKGSLQMPLVFILYEGINIKYKVTVIMYR